MSDRAARDVSDVARDDIVLPYTVESLDSRTRRRLGPAIDAILTRHGYPVPVAASSATPCADGAARGS